MANSHEEGLINGIVKRASEIVVQVAGIVHSELGAPPRMRSADAPGKRRSDAVAGGQSSLRVDTDIRQAAVPNRRYGDVRREAYLGRHQSGRRFAAAQDGGPGVLGKGRRNDCE